MLDNIVKAKLQIDRGIGFYHIGEYDEALEALEASLRLNPVSLLAKQYRGMCKIQCAIMPSDISAGLQDLEEVAKQIPTELVVLG